MTNFEAVSFAIPSVISYLRDESVITAGICEMTMDDSMKTLFVILGVIEALILAGAFALSHWMEEMFLFTVVLIGTVLLDVIVGLAYLVIYLMSRKAGIIGLLVFLAIADVSVFIWNFYYGVGLLLFELAFFLFIVVTGLFATIVNWLLGK